MRTEKTLPSRRLGRMAFPKMASAVALAHGGWIYGPSSGTR